MNALLVTVKEAQEMLGLSDTKVYELAKKGRLEKKYIGKGTRNFRITVASIERYVDNLSVDPIEVDA